MPKNRAAFTLLESLIVLAITMMILSIGLIGIKGNGVGKMQERIFWQSFQKHWQYSERFAVANKTQVDVVFYQNYVRFGYGQSSDQLRYPKGLINLKSRDTIIIKNNGHVSPKTVKWASKNYQRTIKQTFQLGWGVYRIKYEE